MKDKGSDGVRYFHLIIMLGSGQVAGGGRKRVT